jgi:hypothetical protein
MNTAVYQKKKLTFESTRKKVDSVGTTAVSYIVFMNTSSRVSDFIPSNQENTQQNGVMKAVHVFTFAPFLMDNKFNEHINSINNLTHMRSTVYYGTPYTFIFKIFVNITIKETLQ